MNFLHVLEHHLLDHTLAPGFKLGALTLPITKHTVLLWIAAAVLMVVMTTLARRWPVVPTGGRNMLEAFVVFARDDIVLPNTGDEGRKYLPYFLTLFFFILTVNLLGMIPGSASATGNIAVTAALAICTFFLIHIAGIREHGFFHHFKNFIPHGLPAWLVPLMFPLELVGLVTRCFALTIRLFANMIAGHIVLLAFLSLSFLLGSALVNVGAIPIAVGLSLLETFVCFLQAYIFTFLTAIFVGASLHPH
jgi:F-type H+-transporting ATPase subunit a